MTITPDAVGFLVADSAQLIKKIFNRRVRDLEITRSQWAVLWRLSCANGMSQAELAEQAEIEQPSLVRHVDNLEQQGWIVRRRDPNDRRINRIHLTPKGEALMKKAWDVAQQMRQEFTQGLAEDEVQTLRALLSKVKANLAQMDGDMPVSKVERAV